MRSEPSLFSALSVTVALAADLAQQESALVPAALGLPALGLPATLGSAPLTSPGAISDILAQSTMVPAALGLPALGLPPARLTNAVPPAISDILQKAPAIIDGLVSGVAAAAANATADAPRADIHADARRLASVVRRRPTACDADDAVRSALAAAGLDWAASPAQPSWASARARLFRCPLRAAQRPGALQNASTSVTRLLCFSALAGASRDPNESSSIGSSSLGTFESGRWPRPRTCRGRWNRALAARVGALQTPLGHLLYREAAASAENLSAPTITMASAPEGLDLPPQLTPTINQTERVFGSGYVP